MSRSVLFRLWAWPVTLALLSASGLVSALVSDGWGDAWSWLALGLPVAVMAWFGCFKPAAAAPEPAASSPENSPLSSYP